MKVATWNVNSIRARKSLVLSWLGKHEPDVLCLQETKVVDEQFPADEFLEAGYHSACHGQKTYNGVAVLARGPLDDVKRGFGDGKPDEQARLIAATYGGIRMISAYVPNGQSLDSEPYYFKLDWLKRLRGYLDRECAPGSEVALMGDFNIAPEDRDVYDPARWQGQTHVSEPERGALRHILGWGLTDSFRLHHDGDGLFSWWDYRMLAFPKNRGLRIDMIYLSAPLVDRCVTAGIDRNARKGKGTSDHAPVVIELSD